MVFHNMAVASTVLTAMLMLAQTAVGINNDCINNDDCSNERFCANNKCVDPCLSGVCGHHTICHVTGHVALCACRTDYAGHPFSGCYPAPAEGRCSNITAEIESLEPLRSAENLTPSRRKKQKQFHLYTNIKMNWYQALAHCHSQGMHLASLDSREEYDKLLNLIKQSQVGAVDFWLSGTDLGQDGVYIWMSSGKPVTYFNWNVNEPNRLKGEETEHCLELIREFGYKYNDHICSKQNFLACETWN